MRPFGLAILGAAFLALFVALPATSAQVPVPYGFGPAAPFYVPQAGVDPFGRPFMLQVNGAYGPFDGLGYPVVVRTMGFYGGVPVARTTFRYVPVTPPFPPPPPYGAPLPVPLFP